MTRILVVPESLRSLSTQLQRTAQELNGVSSRVASALNGLDWEARQRASVDGMASDARNRATALASQAETMARYLANKAQAFEEADRQGVEYVSVISGQWGAVQQGWQSNPYASCWNFPYQAVAGHLRISGTTQSGRSLPAVTPVPTPTPAQSGASGSGWDVKVGEIVEWGDRLAVFGAAIAIGLSTKPGTAYPGQVIINLPDWLRNIKGLREFREMVGLPGHFNHFKVNNLPSHMLKWGVVFSIPVVINKWIEDLGEYQGTKLVSAMATDFALTLAPVGVAVGTAGLVIALGGPGGIALIGGTVVSVVFDWAVDHYVREKMIEAVDQKIQSAGRTIVSTGRRAISALDQALESTAQGIVNAFQRLAPVTPR